MALNQKLQRKKIHINQHQRLWI